VQAHGRIGPRSGMAGAQFTDLRQRLLVEYTPQPNGKVWQPPNALKSINIVLT
jgi:hypothetical protein